MRPSSDRGFTLMELLVVVLIIGILSALAVPEISSAMANRRMGEGAVRVMGIFRVARARALGRGLAQLVRYKINGGRGWLEHWEGTTNSCASTDWDAVTATRGSVPTYLDRLVDEVNFATAGTPWMASDIRLDRISLTGTAASANLANTVDICYTPLGRTRARSASTGAFSENLGNLAGIGGFQLRIQRFQSGSPVGVSRYVVVPAAGTPRLQILRTTT